MLFYHIKQQRKKKNLQEIIKQPVSIHTSIIIRRLSDGCYGFHLIVGDGYRGRAKTEALTLPARVKPVSVAITTTVQEPVARARLRVKIPRGEITTARARVLELEARLYMVRMLGLYTTC